MPSQTPGAGGGAGGMASVRRHKDSGYFVLSAERTVTI